MACHRDQYSAPYYFLFFTNDLPLNISSTGVTCSCFADSGTLDFYDANVFSVNLTLQQSLNVTSKWCADNFMIPNTGKTKCMLVATRQNNQLNPPPLNLFLGSEQIQQVKEHRVLGTHIDNCLSWQSQTDKICKVVSRNLFLLAKLKYFTDRKTRQQFYNAHIKSHIDYVSSVWDGCSDANFKRIKLTP